MTVATADAPWYVELAVKEVAANRRDRFLDSRGMLGCSQIATPRCTSVAHPWNLRSDEAATKSPYVDGERLGGSLPLRGVRPVEAAAWRC